MGYLSVGVAMVAVLGTLALNDVLPSSSEPREAVPASPARVERLEDEPCPGCSVVIAAANLTGGTLISSDIYEGLCVWVGWVPDICVQAVGCELILEWRTNTALWEPGGGCALIPVGTTFLEVIRSSCASYLHRHKRLFFADPDACMLEPFGARPQEGLIAALECEPCLDVQGDPTPKPKPERTEYQQFSQTVPHSGAIESAINALSNLQSAAASGTASTSSDVSQDWAALTPNTRRLRDLFAPHRLGSLRVEDVLRNSILNPRDLPLDSATRQRIQMLVEQCVSALAPELMRLDRIRERELARLVDLGVARPLQPLAGEAGRESGGALALSRLPRGLTYYEERSGVTYAAGIGQMPELASALQNLRPLSTTLAGTVMATFVEAGALHESELRRLLEGL